MTAELNGNVFIFPHGDTVREMELMIAYRMKPIYALPPATSAWNVEADGKYLST